MSGELEVDHDRFIYEEVHEFGRAEPFWIRVGCHHRHVEDVKNLHTHTVVARLCIDCDTQLPVEGPIEW